MITAKNYYMVLLTNIILRKLYWCSNVGGDCKLHESFNTNPLVNVCARTFKEKKYILGNACQDDLYTIYAGSKTVMKELTSSDGIQYIYRF